MTQQILQWIVATIMVSTLLLSVGSVFTTPFVLAAAFMEVCDDKRARAVLRKRTLWALLAWAVLSTILGIAAVWRMPFVGRGTEGVFDLALFGACSLHFAACCVLVRWVSKPLPATPNARSDGSDEKAPQAPEGACEAVE